MKYRKLAALVLAGAICFSLAACGNGASTTTDTAGTITTVSSQTSSQDDLFTDRDYDASYETAVTITLNGDTAVASGDGVTVEGTVVTITQAGTYLLTGEMTDGQVMVDVGESEKVQLVLSDAAVASSTSAALYVKSADKVFLTLAAGTKNALSATDSFVQRDDNQVDGAVFSKCTLTINGSGSLTVDCAQGHGIVSKDTLKVTGGQLTVHAASSALTGKDSVRIAGGTLNLTAGKDGIHSENTDDSEKGFIYILDGTFSITADSDGMDASQNVTVKGGTITLTVGDDGIHADGAQTIVDGSVTVTESYEGLEGQTVNIQGGTVSVTASDDGINAADGSTTAMGPGAADSSCAIHISGGEVRVDASGDGLDSNGDLTVTGGTVYVSGACNGGDSALDYDGTATISGGVVVAAGYSGMAQNFGAASTQGSILYPFSQTMTGGTEVTLTDSSGTVLAAFAPEKEYQCVVISAPGITAGSSYTVSAGEESGTVTMESLIYGGGNMGGGMGGRGGPSDGNFEDKNDTVGDGNGSMTPPDGNNRTGRGTPAAPSGGQPQ